MSRKIKSINLQFELDFVGVSYGATRAGAILAGGFQKVFENLALVDIFRICSTTKNQRFSRGFSEVFDFRFSVDIFRIFSM